MIRLFFILVFLGSASLAQAQFDVQEKLEKKIIQDKYVAFLTDKGYSPEVDSDGDVKFTYKERSYYITIDMKDKNFFRLARLANLKLDSESQITKAKEICHEITQDVKVAKVYWLKGVVWTSSEIVLENPDDYSAIFDRVLRLTESAYLKFVKRWKDA
ncbi:hypothetical protein BFP97_12235 [Roseivirga sp. 4D4]|uniref:hypothetical protein n=1 Tax=Roseivirga sp. 4D4 TaxID=1889784 RepID=UPI0008535720|nr:hypothetical protein [Roseivirga sp. 4D4]OEK02237.1 hypothetical protein BFP97_12235 [Roseivirga sp. 4D4]